MKRLALVAMLGMGLAGFVHAEVDADQVTYYRQSIFGVVSGQIGVLSGMAKGDIAFDADKAKLAAERLNMMAIASSETFIDGTYESSNVKTAINRDRADFDKKMTAFHTEAAAMVDAAADLKTLRPQLGKLGGTCKSCHDAYKAD